MVDRQYDTMRRERLRLAEDPNSARNLPRPEEHELPSAAAPTANGATEAPVNEQEVSKNVSIKSLAYSIYRISSTNCC